MRRKQRFGPAFLVLGIMFVLIGAYVCFAYNKVKPDDNTICSGVYIEKVNVGGMTKDQAGAAFQPRRPRSAIPARQRRRLSRRSRRGNPAMSWLIMPVCGRYRKITSYSILSFPIRIKS